VKVIGSNALRPRIEAKGRRRVDQTGKSRCVQWKFERTRAISSQTAEEIAATAKRFGQQDDITVLTLGFAPVEVAHV
jgi:hypothetical protein